jgi:hypothetical protein
VQYTAQVKSVRAANRVNVKGRLPILVEQPLHGIAPQAATVHDCTSDHRLVIRRERPERPPPLLLVPMRRRHTKPPPQCTAVDKCMDGALAQPFPRVRRHAAPAAPRGLAARTLTGISHGSTMYSLFAAAHPRIDLDEKTAYRTKSDRPGNPQRSTRTSSETRLTNVQLVH